MSDDLHHRIAAAVRTIADAPPVSPPPPETLRQPTRTPRGRRWAPALVAAAVLALVAGIGVIPVGGGGTGRRPADPAGPPATLPARFAGPSWLTASVSDAPPGPAIALYQQQTGDSRHPTTVRQVT